MEKLSLTAQVREKAGKGVARGLRREQKVPAILYSHGKSMPLAMDAKSISRILNTEGGEHALINLTLGGSKETAARMALVKDYQVDPISGGLLHVDLMEVALDEKVKIPVAVHVTGAALGVKEGGILQYGLREIEIECLPHQIPESINVNVSELKINESIHVRDIKLAEGIRILTEPEATVATIQPPISDAKLEQMLTAAPPAETGEPELVKKPKKEAEAAAPAEGAKEAAAAPAKEAAKTAAPAKEAKAAPKK